VVEAGVGFVEDDQARLAAQFPGEADPLARPARQLKPGLAEEVGDVVLDGARERLDVLR
jgi:hypothetical protein